MTPGRYAKGSNGFLLRDRTENSAIRHEQVYVDRQHTTHTPAQVLTWG